MDGLLLEQPKVLIINNFGLGSSFALCPLEALQPVWLFVQSPFSKRSYFGRQVPRASTTCSSPLASKGGTMGEKWWPNGAWDMHPGFFYVPQICNVGPIIYFPSEGRRAEEFYCSLKILRLRPGLNPQTWVSEASMLPLHHRSRYSPKLLRQSSNFLHFMKPKSSSLCSH